MLSSGFRILGRVIIAANIVIIIISIIASIMSVTSIQSSRNFLCSVPADETPQGSLSRDRQRGLFKSTCCLDDRAVHVFIDLGFRVSLFQVYAFICY